MGSTSKAIRYDRYGSPEVLELREVDPPVPGDDQVLVRVRAASVNPLDWHELRGQPYVLRLANGLTKPKDGRLGADLAGTVEAVGNRVTRFRPGDEVFGMSAATLAESVRVAEAGLVPKPDNLTFEQAAAAPLAGLTALQGLRDYGRIRAGQRVLVNGASGGVGTFAVQIAKAFGAEVIGVCSSRNLELVRSLGADQVIDYTRTDFCRNGQRYDLILDLAGNRSVTALRRILSPGGGLVLAAAPPGNWIAPLMTFGKPLLLSPFVRQRLRSFLAKRSQPDLTLLAELLAAGTVTPVIDRTYPLAGAPDAIRHLETGHARGKVVITV